MDTFTGVFALLVLVGFGGQFYFLLGGHLAAKRRYFRWWIGAVGLLFVALPLAGGMAPVALIVWVPAVIGVGFLVHYQYRFCDKCGAMVPMGFRDTRHCGRCGAAVHIEAAV